MSKTKNQPRLTGPRRRLIQLVEVQPGCRPMYAARCIGPHGSLQFGYAVVNRAAKSGLVQLRSDPFRKGARVLVPAGMAWV